MEVIKVRKGYVGAEVRTEKKFERMNEKDVVVVWIDKDGWVFKERAGLDVVWLSRK